MRVVFAKLGRQPASLAVAALIVAAAFVYYLTGSASADENAATAQQPPPPAVGVTTLEQREIRTWALFSGRMTPVDSVAIKPLVGGIIQKVFFEEGDVVEAGAPLFLIDPRPHEAAVKRAEAQLASAASRANLAADELARAKQLLGNNLVSQSVFDAANNDDRMAKAAVADAEGALMQAKLNLEYAHITAPVTGRISRAELTVGNVVEAGPGAPVLATIVSNDRLYAEFNVDEQTYVRFVRTAPNPATMPVEMALDADSSVIYEGHIHSFDNRLDTGSGTIRARAIFDNTDGALTAGMYAEVRLGAAQLREALVVPERAIGTNQDKKFVYVVDDNNTAVYREITPGESWRGQRIIDAGVQAGERVIVNGLSHVRPNSPVTPSPVAEEVAVAR